MKDFSVFLLILYIFLIAGNLYFYFAGGYWYSLATACFVAGITIHLVITMIADWRNF